MIRFRMVGDRRLKARLAHMNDTAQSPKRLWDRIHRDQQTLSALTIRALSDGGGSYRGVQWPGFRPQYVREDGTEVPAWGGVDKVRGKGRVKGRLRPSGTRVTARSLIMRDTGYLASAAASVRKTRRSGRLLIIETPVKYAAPQQSMRPFMFFTRADRQKYRKWAAEIIMERP